MESMPRAAVGALIFNQEGKLLLIRTHKWSHKYGIPGGKIDYAETAEQALKREIMEETGLAVYDIRFVMMQDCVKSKEYYKRDAHFILLDYACKTKGRKVKLNYEAQGCRWVKPEDALKLNLNKPTRGLILEYLKHKGKILLRGLSYTAVIGVKNQERKNKQAVKVDVEMLYDFSKIKKDRLNYALDYDKVNALIGRLLEKKKYKLLETAALDIAKTLLEKFNLSKAAVKIIKTNAIKNAEYAAAEFSREI